MGSDEGLVETNIGTEVARAYCMDARMVFGCGMSVLENQRWDIHHVRARAMVSAEKGEITPGSLGGLILCCLLHHHEVSVMVSMLLGDSLLVSPSFVGIATMKISSHRSGRRSMFPLFFLTSQRWYAVGLLRVLLVGKREFLWVGFESVGWFGDDHVNMIFTIGFVLVGLIYMVVLVEWREYIESDTMELQQQDSCCSIPGKLRVSNPGGFVLLSGIFAQCMLPKLGIDLKKNIGRMLIIDLHELSAVVTPASEAMAGVVTSLVDYDIWEMCLHRPNGVCVLGLIWYNSAHEGKATDHRQGCVPIGLSEILGFNWTSLFGFTVLGE
ncbi:hypothetical protein L1987_10008 [Smallanthus sonchifolius]|uniref:Uncharacterized protein n=1 Tax=Smallanthus sonchifolius TaxID=185202 RepID=A0ACB9JQW8_9ASTR|nr:hypothetical protein L1987_10008 [Smallanthus sonchifolius]